MEEMSSAEVEGWFEYFKHRPYGWQEDQRAALIMNALGVKKKPHELFDSIRAVRDHQKKSEPAPNAAVAFMRKFGDKFPQLKLEE